MVNVIAEKVVYEEFLQKDVRPEILVPALEAILPGGKRRQEVEEGIKTVVEKLGGETDAFKNAAEVILKSI